MQKRQLELIAKVIVIRLGLRLKLMKGVVLQ